MFVAHSTCGVTTIEFEPGCNADLARVIEQVAPTDDSWEHNERNADTNGHSHARAALIGPSVTVPFADGELLPRRVAEDRLHRLRRPAAPAPARRADARRLTAQSRRVAVAPTAIRSRRLLDRYALDRVAGGAAPAARHLFDPLVEHVFFFDRELAADAVVVESAGPAGADDVETGQVPAGRAPVSRRHAAES